MSSSLHQIGDDFPCPFCKVKGCCVAEEDDDEGDGRRAVQHPLPICAQFEALEADEFAKAASIDIDCRCELLATEGLVPGWGCCSCRCYNGDWRVSCKHCTHSPTPHPYGRKPD